MRADICQPEDESAVANLKQAIEAVGARLVHKHLSTIGVDLYEYRVGDETLNVFSDAWSVDIDGSQELVERVLTVLHAKSNEPLRPPG